MLYIRCLFFSLVLLLKLVTIPLYAQSHGEKELVRIGVLAFDEPLKNFARWQPTIDYLNEHLPEYQFTLISGDIKSIEQLVASGTIDFVISNSVVYNQFQNNYQAVRVLSLDPLVGTPQLAIGSAVIARREMSDIQNWHEISQKRIVATMPEAFGGFQIMHGEWLRQGIDPMQEFEHLQFVGLPQKKLLTLVAQGQADIAILPTCILENAVSEGSFFDTQFHVLNVQEQHDLPCLSSSSLYPFWVLSRAAHVNESMARDVAQLLLAIRPTDIAAISGQYKGWTVPISDHAVHDLMRVLHSGEEELSLLTLLWQRYQGWLFIALAAGVLFFGYHLRVNYLVRLRTRQLQKAMVEKEEAAQKLHEQQEQFYSAQRILLSGELAAGLAHELNQPLMAINSYVAGCRMRLKQQPLDLEAFDGALKHAVQQTVNAKDIIRRTRRFIKDQPPQQTYFLLNAAIQNAFALFEHEFRRLGIKVVLPEESQVVVFADEVLIQQVLVNLISNAKDAIDARENPAEKGQIRISLETKDGFVTCMVCDNGVGMTDKQREHLFVPFNTSKENGMGLGMITCKRIIDAHQGRIGAQEHPNGQGACVYFSLPYERKN